ncbi:O-antigen polymerase [Carnobacterium sp. FSL E2-0243]|uniref:O-antigen polymerase n=1 Tax=Carnobacterium sp. FSL E2-0243 TaxID=2921365 RepID=UPI0030F92A2E
MFNRFTISEYAQIIIFTILGVLSSQTVNLFPTKQSMTGGANVYIIELVVIFFSVYVIVYQLFFKRKLKEMPSSVKYMLLMVIIFGFFFIAMTSLRILTHQSLANSMYLPRVVMEAGLIYICLSFFKVRAETVFASILTLFVVLNLWDYGILFFGNGVIRGTSPVFGNSYVFAIFCSMVAPLLMYFYIKGTKKMKVAMAILYVLNIPISILTGSRTVLILSIGFMFLTILLYSSGIKKMFYYFILVIAPVIIIAGSFILFASPQNKSYTFRSFSIPISIVKKVTPESIDKKIDEFTSVEILEKKKDVVWKNGKVVSSTEEKEKLVNNSLERESQVSQFQREDVNNRAKEEIQASTQNLLFGSGKSLVLVYSGRLEKPHNYFLQYTLAFGLIGFFLTVLIYFSPIVFAFKKMNKKDFCFFVLTGYLSVLINGQLQPAFGNIIAIYLMMIMAYGLLKWEEGGKYEKNSY